MVRRWISGFGQVIIHVVVAAATWMFSAVALMSLPYTPHHRVRELMDALSIYAENQPKSAAATDAFDEFLRVGYQAEWIEVTVLPLLAAGAVTALSRMWPPICRNHWIAVSLGFGAFVARRSGIATCDWLDGLNIAVFSLALWGGQRWIAVPRASPGC